MYKRQASAIARSAGTWTPTIASNLTSDVRTANDSSFTLLIPVPVPSNASTLKGAYLKSIDVFYKIATADADDFASVALDKITLPVPAAATGSAFTGASVAITQDAYHDSAAERKAIGNHTMTVSLSAPTWVDDNDAYMLSCVVDAAATTAFSLYGARANYTLRV